MQKHQAAPREANGKNDRPATPPRARERTPPREGVTPPPCAAAADDARKKASGARGAFLMARPMIMPARAPEQAPPSPSTTSPSPGSSLSSSPSSPPAPVPGDSDDSAPVAGGGLESRTSSLRAVVELGVERDIEEEMHAASAAAPATGRAAVDRSGSVSVSTLN